MEDEDHADNSKQRTEKDGKGQGEMVGKMLSEMSTEIDQDPFPQGVYNCEVKGGKGEK